MRISGFLRIFAVFPGFLRIFADFNFLSQFFFVKNLYFFLLFLGFSAKISTKNLVPIFKNSQGQCPRKDFRIFPVLSGFIRILISCPNFFLKKDKFFIFIFCKKFIFFSFILGFSAKFRFKKSGPNFRKFPRSMSQNLFLGFPLFSGFFRINPDFLFLVPIFDKFFIFIFL